MWSYKIKLKHILILRLVEILSYLIEMYTMTLKLKDQMKKLVLNQDFPHMSRDIILLHKLLETKVLDQ